MDVPPDKFGPLGLTFDDVGLMPAASDVLPGEAATAARLTREITVRRPLAAVSHQLAGGLRSPWATPDVRPSQSCRRGLDWSASPRPG